MWQWLLGVKDPQFRWRSASLAGLSLRSCQWNQRTQNCRIFRRRLVGSYLIKITTVQWPLGKQSFALVQTQIKGFSGCFKYIWLSKIFEKYGTVFTFKLHQQLRKNVVLRKVFWDERENKWLFSSTVRSLFCMSQYALFFSSLCPAIYGHEVSSLPALLCNFRLKCLCHSKLLQDL